MRSLNLLIFLVSSFFLFSCGDQPKVIESTSEPSASAEGSSALDEITSSTSATAEHRVEVEEVLHTEKYSYLQVKEGEDSHWIAIPRSDVEVGDQLLYRGGLMKKNFLSREYNRVFEKLYLVSDIRKLGPAGTQSGTMGGDHPSIDVSEVISPAEGAVAISELMAHPEKYDGITIMVTGKVVKVNPMIMNRNWIHLQDGTSEKNDLTVTTAENIPLGSLITVEGTIALNKDFGAGYRYAIIMEGATLVK